MYIRKRHAEEKALLTIPQPGQHPSSPVTSALLRTTFAACRREAPALGEQRLISPRAWQAAHGRYRGAGGRVVAGARRPPPKQTLPGLGAGARPHGGEPRPDTPDAPREPGTTLLSLHGAGRQGPQPPRALAELCPRAQGGEATRSQRTNDICPIAKAACLPLRSGGGVPTKRVYQGTIYFRRRNAN